MPNLQQLVQRELARHQDEGSSYNPLDDLAKLFGCAPSPAPAGPGVAAAQSDEPAPEAAN
jgi:hypothetical protein